MSLADAIAIATGLDPAKDFEVRATGDGVFIMSWDEAKTKIPLPDQAQLDQWEAEYQQKLPAIKFRAFVKSIAKDYLEALIYRDELKDDSLMLVMQAKIAAALADSKVVPTPDPVTP